jgi:hypothetical protein
MELGSLFLILAVLVVVGVYLYAPLATRARRLSTGDTHEISALQAERDRVINALQELDFDFKLGKIPAEDYPEQRAELLQRARTFSASWMNLRLPPPPGGTPRRASKKPPPQNAETPPKKRRNSMMTMSSP